MGERLAEPPNESKGGEAYGTDNHNTYTYPVID